MGDRLVNGGIAGMAGGLIQYIYSLLAYNLGVLDNTFGDYAEALISGKNYHGIQGSIVGILGYLGVGLLFGVIFAYIILYTSENYYLIKGLMYGMVLWVILSGFGVIFKLPLFLEDTPMDNLTELTSGLVFGLTIAYCLKLLSKKSCVK